MSWTRFLRRRFWHDERAREIEAYLAIETDEQIARGLTPADARAAAQRKLGNELLILEEIHRMNTLRFVEACWQDLRYAVRSLSSAKGFTLVALLSLALGIGANTAMFQLLVALQLRSLPVERPEELARIRIGNTNCCRGTFRARFADLTWAQWEQIEQRQQAFDRLFAWSARSFSLVDGGDERQAEAILVGGDFFAGLGVHAVLGRTLGVADDVRGCDAPAVVISHAFWQREFGGVPNVLGRPLRVEGRPLTIVGVADPAFFGLEVGRTFDVAVPLCAAPLLAGDGGYFDGRDTWWLSGMGRLKPGWTHAQAAAHLAALSPPLFQSTVPSSYPASAALAYRAFALTAEPGGAGVSRLRRQFGGPLGLLLAITGLVLLIACANIANLRSRVRVHASGRWRSDSPSGHRAGASCGSCSPRACCCRRSARSRAPCSRVGSARRSSRR